MKLLKVFFMLFFVANSAVAGVERIMPEHYEFLYSDAKGKNNLIINKLLSGCTHFWMDSETLEYDTKTRKWIRYSFGALAPLDQTNIKDVMNFLLARQFLGLATSISVNQPHTISCASILCVDTANYYHDKPDIRFMQCMDASSGKVRANVFGATWVNE